jgi:hypothetical protein
MGGGSEQACPLQVAGVEKSGAREAAREGLAIRVSKVEFSLLMRLGQRA